MPPGPVPPSTRHVWVHNHGRHGSGDPGVVILWLPQFGTDEWQALIAVQHSPGTVSVSWHPGHLIDPITDPTPAHWSKERRGVRHVWRAPLHEDGRPAPGLLVDQRRTDRDGWQAHVAVVNTTAGTLHVSWEPPDKIRPVTDDRADKPPPKIGGR